MKYKNGIRGVGADISEAALDIARKNEELIFGADVNVSDAAHERVDWVLSDMFEKVSGAFDIIVSNPPYIQSEVITGLMPEVKDHEPLSALDGGTDGLDYYRIIAREAPAHLNRHGRLYLETGFDEAEAVSELLRSAGFAEIETLKDYAGNDRVVKCTVHQ